MHIAALPQRLSVFTLAKPPILWHRLLMGILLVGVASQVLAGYREDNIELFRITLPSTTTDHLLPADFETAGELVVGWKCGNLDALVVEVIQTTKPVVPVVVLADSTVEISCMQSALASYGVSLTGISFEIAVRETPWVGDYGPLAIRHVSSGRISFVDPRYFDPQPLDDKVPTELALTRGINVFRPSVFLPRSVVTNGAGTCLMSKRDGLENLPDPDEAGLATLMEDYLGCTQVVFLPPLVTAGMGDLRLALKFVDEDTALVGDLHGGVDCVNADLLDSIAATLGSLQLPSGGDIEVVRVPFPPDSDGVFRSYTDFIMVNGVTVIPSYPEFPGVEAEAYSIIHNRLPAWNHVLVDASDLADFAGGLGSLAANLPAGDYSAQQAAPGLVCGDLASCQSTGCGSVTFEGFCSNDTVVWCEDTQIMMSECSTPCFFASPGDHCEKSCGWAPAGYYDCVGVYDCGQPEIFADGFEDGSVSAWSNSTQ